MLNCRDITGMATSYSEGQLGLAQRWSFRLHLALCEACRRYVRQLEATVDVLKRGPISAGAQPSEEAREALLKAFRARQKPPS